MRKSTVKPKLKHRKRKQHKSNKQVVRREGYSGEANDISKNPKPTSRNTDNKIQTPSRKHSRQ